MRTYIEEACDHRFIPDYKHGPDGLVAYLVNYYPQDKTRFNKMKVGQLRAIIISIFRRQAIKLDRL